MCSVIGPGEPNISSSPLTRCTSLIMGDVVVVLPITRVSQYHTDS